MKTIDEIYQAFDQLVESDDADLLFASSYLRGFISLCCAQVDAVTSTLTPALASDIEQQLTAAKNELNPHDQSLVSDFWQQVKQGKI